MWLCRENSWELQPIREFIPLLSMDNSGYLLLRSSGIMIRMHSFRLLIALSMVLGLGYSQCTGGLMHIPYAIASGAEEGTGDDLAMSIAPPMECSSAQTQSPAQTTKTQSGCRDGESCLEQIVQRGAKHLETEEVTGGGTLEILPLPILIAYASTDGLEIDLRAQNGPLYENAALLAHITVKRE